jgi:hypothetical protein
MAGDGHGEVSECSRCPFYRTGGREVVARRWHWVAAGGACHGGLSSMRRGARGGDGCGEGRGG